MGAKVQCLFTRNAQKITWEHVKNNLYNFLKHKRKHKPQKNQKQNAGFSKKRRLFRKKKIHGVA